MAARIWFPESVEVLWCRGLGERLTPLRHELLQLGWDLGPPLRDGYDAELAGAAIRFAAPRVFPELTPEEAMYRFGEIAVLQFADSRMGRAVYPLLRLFGPRRNLLNLQRTFRATNNFTVLEVREVSPDCFRARFEEVDGVPYFWKGMCDRSTQGVGGRRSSERFLFDGHQLVLFFDLRKHADSAFPGEDLERWL